MPQVIVSSIDRELSLEYQIYGEGDRIILIRGLGTQLIEWSPVLIDGLVDADFQVLVFDNRDVGLSEKVETGYTAEAMAADVIGLMDALSMECAHIFGISMGGMIAQLVAHGYPERVRCLYSVMSSSGSPGLSKPKPEVWKWLFMLF